MSAHVMFKPGLPHLNLMNQPVFSTHMWGGKNDLAKLTKVFEIQSGKYATIYVVIGHVA
jgi:hypothetical protein